MLQDTHKHAPSRTSAGGPADTTMRLETRIEGLGTEWTQEPSGNKASPTLVNIIPAKKYPTDTAGTTTLGQQCWCIWTYDYRLYSYSLHVDSGQWILWTVDSGLWIVDVDG